MWFMHGFVHGGPCSRRLAGAALALDASCQRAADDQFRERVRDLAVRLQVGLDVLRVIDHPAVDDDPRDLDRERPGLQVERTAASARQLAASHARGGFEYPEREEPVRACVLQERLELSDRPDLAALARDAGRARVADDVALGPAPGRGVFPGP